jgi:hypothetical protein
MFEKSLTQRREGTEDTEKKKEKVKEKKVRIGFFL